MREKVVNWIRSFVKDYEKLDKIKTQWGEPIVGFADANHSYIQNLPNLVTKTHGLPQDVMDDASIVIVYYVPFTRALAKTNETEGSLAAPEWALAYEETNAMFLKLNEFIITKLAAEGYRGAVSPKMKTFDHETLKSDWSYRHFAYAAGLGTFGINNMLITKKGCCGRFSTVVSNLNVKPDEPLDEDLCLFRKKGGCGVCARHCPTGALTVQGYDCHRCYTLLKKNAAVYTEFGSSYVNKTGTSANSTGSEVCGKCITQSPCAFWNVEK